MFEDSRQKDFMCGALIGGTVALLTSLLFTTKKGKEIQCQIADAYEELKENIEDKASTAKEKAEEGVDYLHKKMTKKNNYDDDQKNSK